MPHYRVLVRGRNFWLRHDTGPECVGFYTTRFVQAASEIEAESAAVELIKQDPKLGRSVLNERADPPIMFVEDVDEVEVEDVPHVTPGFAFYPASQDSDS